MTGPPSRCPRWNNGKNPKKGFSFNIQVSRKEKLKTEN